MAMVRLSEYAIKGVDGRYADLADHPMIKATMINGKEIAAIIRKSNMVIVVVEGFPIQFDSEDAKVLDDMVQFFYQIHMRFGD